MTLREILQRQRRTLRKIPHRNASQGKSTVFS
jgi:hypothetical protein